MKKNKFKILTLAIAAMLTQGTCVYATYTEEDFENMSPGYEWSDIDKSNQKVTSYTNSYSSEKTSENNTKTTKTTAKTASTVELQIDNDIVSTVPSTGVNGDYWGKTSEGKWVLLEQGIPVRGWKQVTGNWYYMDEYGVMQTGWIDDGENWYYLKDSGDMAYNTTIDGYYLDWNGAMQ
jgi:hypothetical protein